MPPVTELPLPARPSPRRFAQPGPLAAGAVAALLGAAYLGGDGWRPAVLWVIGLLLGSSLHHASFGFASAYRRMFIDRDVRGVQAQLLMLAVAVVIFAPLLAQGMAFGREVVGAAAPVGTSVAVGAFAFGIGMQLAGGCGSGTLYTAGGGSVRMVLVLLSACAGSFWASLHMGWWQALPSWDAIVLGDRLGWPGAVALQLAFIAMLAWLLRRWGVSPREAQRRPAIDARTLLTGPWPAMAAAVVLALLNLATLVVAGHPWTITWAFTLWGAKAAAAIGWQPADGGFWSGDFQSAALAAGVLEDTTSLMDIAIMVGAFCAAASAGRLAPKLHMSRGALASALLGGVLIGYAARIAYGCNIGAFFSGVASASLHGWLWIACALLGSRIGIGLRPRFGLAN